MKRMILQALARLCGNRPLQRLLGLNALVSQYLMGIGPGASVESSGQAVLWRRLRQQARPGETLCVFDVGANKGQFLALITHGLAGLPFQVHAFEPGRKAFEALSAKAENAPTVKLIPMALGRETGEMELFYDKAGSAIASLYHRRLDHFGIDFELSEKVRVQTLDGYCAEHGISRIDLLKLDVEGHELEVLHGGRRMFLEHRVRMVTFEFGGCNIDSRTFLQDFFYFFKEHGFSAMYRITLSGYLWPIREYREADEQFRTTNFLVCHA